MFFRKQIFMTDVWKQYSIVYFWKLTWLFFEYLDIELYSYLIYLKTRPIYKKNIEQKIGKTTNIKMFYRYKKWKEIQNIESCFTSSLFILR